MNALITLPLWLLIVIGLFASLGFWLAVVAPLFGRLFYQRHQQRIRKLDEELKFGLPSYADASRRDWLDRLLNDAVVVSTMNDIAAESGLPLEELQSRARRDAEEIVPFFNVVLYFRIGYWLGRWVLRTLFWLKTRFDDEAALGEIDRDCCVVLVSNHRSNLDPFILIYMASRRSAISFSAGEWALVWPFRYLLHSLGFYIIRRDDSSDRLYRTLVERFVFLSASHCIPQGLFLEGALSLDGRMQPIKLGLLDYMLRAHGEGHCRDIVFVPAGMSYERIPEARTLLANQGQGFRNKSRYYASLSFLRFVVLVMPRMLGFSKPYGKVVANFGAPLSLNQWLKEKNAGTEAAESGQSQAAVLGQLLKQKIERLVPILPVSLLAKVLLESGDDGLSESTLMQRGLALGSQLNGRELPVDLAAGNEDRELGSALYLLLKDGYVELGGDARLRCMGTGRRMLEYYANAIPTDESA